MYKILIAEDSKMMVRDIIRQIEKSAYRTEIRAVYDGEEAIEILKTFAPDIILTDIKMPVFDGLTLIQRAKNDYPDVRCAIISGYSDFTYMHEALMLHVDDYIMKPVDSGQFQALMAKLTSQVDAVRIKKEELALQRQLQEDILLSADGLLSAYMLVLVRVGLFQQYAAPLSKELIKELLPGIIGDAVAGGNIWVVNTRLDNEKVLVCDLLHQSNDVIVRQCSILMGKLKKQYLNVNIICSPILSDIHQLGRQYMEIANHLDRKMLLDQCNVYEDISWQSEQPEYLRQKKELDIFRIKMERIIKNKSAGDYRREIQKSVLKWDNEKYPVAVLRKFIIILLDELFIESGAKVQGLMEEPGTLADKILNDCKKYGELENCLYEYSELISGAKEEKPGVSLEMAQKITDYMRAGIYSNLSLQNITDYFEISPSYVCRLFKMYYGDTPISYYNRLKIEEAKNILNEYQDIRMKDVADMLGFSEQYYFSKVFKQQYGVSPLVYKTQLNNN